MAKSTIEPGSLVVVAGGTGYIGSAISRLLLQYGYQVRATARSLSKAIPLKERFSRELPNAKFEVVHVPDYTVEGAYDNALQGAQGFVIVAGDVSLSLDAQAVINSTKQAIEHMFDSARRTTTLRRVVLTSSRDASFYGEEDLVREVDQDTWNDAIVQQALATPDSDPNKATYVYSAGKVIGERAAFAQVERHRPHFVFNSVLPELVFGRIWNPFVTSCTGSWMNELFMGSPDNILPFFINSTYAVHTEDVARMHLAALIEEDVQNERIWAASVPATVNDVLGVFRKNFPDRTFLPDYQEGRYSKQTRIRIDLRRSVELLKRQGKAGFADLDVILTDNVESLGALK